MTSTVTSSNGNVKPFVRIVEQPAKCAIRFRYECEGRSAGSIPGVNSTPENKTFPTIQVCNYNGKAVVVVSCVTKEPPYRPHPHNLVGKEGCKKGVCTLVIDNNPEMICTFTSLGIQCVKRNKIEESLKLRELIKVDPFRTGFLHRTQPSSIDLNCLRLCFQVFIEGPEKGKFTVQLPPVVSEAIYDKKAMAELIIVKLSHYSAPCTGGKEIILLCDRVAKDDIQVRFVQESTQGIVWESWGEFMANDVHKQVAISLRTPKYIDENISQPVTVQIQLRRPSDGCLSLPRSFQITPRELDPDGIVRKRHKRLKEENYELLKEYLQLADRQSPGQIASTSKLMPVSTAGIVIKTELPSSTVVSSPRSFSNNTGQQTQQFQYIQHSSPQHIAVADNAASSRMSPKSFQNAGPYIYNNNNGNNNETYTSSFDVIQPQTTGSPQKTSSSSSMAYALAAAMVASSSGSSPTHHFHPQQHFQQGSPNPSQGSYSSPIHSPASIQQQHQQEIPNEVMERFDSLDIDSSELIPDLDLNSNTMLSLMMDSSGLSLTDSFSDITNNNAQQNGSNNTLCNGQLDANANQQSQTQSLNENNNKSASTKIYQANSNKLKLNINNNNNISTTASLDTPIIEMMTNSSGIQVIDSSAYENILNTANNNIDTNHQPIFSALDLDNNNHITHLN